MRVAHVVVPVLTCLIGFAGGVYYARSGTVPPPAEIQGVRPPAAPTEVNEDRVTVHNEYWEDLNPEQSDGEGGVLVIGDSRPDTSSGGREAPEDDAELQARAEFFENSLDVVKAVRYCDGGPGAAVTDVYLVRHDEWICESFFIQAIQWYDEDAAQGFKRRKDIHASGYVARMYLFDVDGDGNREIITVCGGANSTFLCIYDLRRPDDDAHVFEEEDGALACGHIGGTWTFKDLNGDGKCECIARAIHKPWWARPKDGEGLTMVERYEVYEIDGERYRLRCTFAEDPLEDERLMAQALDELRR